MQLDVDMSPPANDIDFRLDLTLLTFDLDPLVTDIQTESDAYEHTVHTHRWAQKGESDVRFVRFKFFI